MNMVGTTPTPDGGNCFSDNVAATESPTNLQQKAPCGAPPSGDFAEGALDVAPLIARASPRPSCTRTSRCRTPGRRPTCPTRRRPRPRPQRARRPSPTSPRSCCRPPGSVIGLRAARVASGRGVVRRRGRARRGSRPRRPWSRPAGEARGLPPGRPNSDLSYDGAMFVATCAFSHSAERRPDRLSRAARTVTPTRLLREHRDRRRLDGALAPPRRDDHLRPRGRQRGLLGAGAAPRRCRRSPEGRRRLLPGRARRAGRRRRSRTPQGWR